MKGRPLTAEQIDEICARYATERSADLARSLGLSLWTVQKIAREKQVRLSAHQRWRKRSPYGICKPRGVADAP